MSQFVGTYTRPRRYAPEVLVGHFDVEAAIKTIAGVMHEAGISQRDMLDKFPKRPTTEGECEEISRWLRRRMQFSAKASRQAAEAQTVSVNPPGPSAQAMDLADGYYAIPAGEFSYEKPHFFRLKTGKNGKWAGFKFLEEQASDEFYPVKGAAKKGIMAYLVANAAAAQALYGREIGRCARCHRTLTDQNNPYFAAGLGPECGTK